MLLATVEPQMVLPPTDLPATARSSPGHPLSRHPNASDRSSQWVAAPWAGSSSPRAASSAPWVVLTSQYPQWGSATYPKWVPAVYPPWGRLCSRWTPLFRHWRRIVRRLVSQPTTAPFSDVCFSTHNPSAACFLAAPSCVGCTASGFPLSPYCPGRCL